MTDNNPYLIYETSNPHPSRIAKLKHNAENYEKTFQIILAIGSPLFFLVALSVYFDKTFFEVIFFIPLFGIIVFLAYKIYYAFKVVRLLRLPSVITEQIFLFKPKYASGTFAAVKILIRLAAESNTEEHQQLVSRRLGLALDRFFHDKPDSQSIVIPDLSQTLREALLEETERFGILVFKCDLYPLEPVKPLVRSRADINFS